MVNSKKNKTFNNNMKTIFLIGFVLIALITPVKEANAFSLFGIDVGKVWNKITFWNNDDEVEKNNNTSNVDKNTNKASKKSTTPKAKVNYNVSLAGKLYTESYLISVFKNDAKMQDYVKGFNYECMAITTDKDTKFTLYFNTEQGTLNKMRTKVDCEKEIFLEESLIEDISKEGFKAGNIKTYLKKTELPTSMYFKAVKVFTVG